MGLCFCFKRDDERICTDAFDGSIKIQINYSYVNPSVNHTGITRKLGSTIQLKGKGSGAS
jgi:hypothetical protein